MFKSAGFSISHVGGHTSASGALKKHLCALGIRGDDTKLAPTQHQQTIFADLKTNEKAIRPDVMGWTAPHRGRCVKDAAVGQLAQLLAQASIIALGGTVAHALAIGIDDSSLNP